MGIVLVSDGDFRGWVRKNDKHVIETELEEGKVLRGKFTLIESLNWEAGGGEHVFKARLKLLNKCRVTPANYYLLYVFCIPLIGCEKIY